jgi:hypothetical protein
LNAAQARYVLIGGFAVIAHGAGRFTKDLDLLVDDAADNVARVRQALSILADNAVAEVADGDIQAYQVVRVVDEIIVDLMGRACGLTYHDVSGDVELLEFLGVTVPVASPGALIRMKNTMRPQDAIDRAFLEAVLRDRNLPTDAKG